MNEMYDYMVPVANEIRHRIKMARRPEQVVIQARAATQSIPDLIKQVASLKEAGILTDEEFQAKKKDLLAKM